MATVATSQISPVAIIKLSYVAIVQDHSSGMRCCRSRRNSSRVSSSDSYHNDTIPPCGWCQTRVAEGMQVSTSRHMLFCGLPLCGAGSHALPPANGSSIGDQRLWLWPPVQVVVADKREEADKRGTTPGTRAGQRSWPWCSKIHRIRQWPCWQ
jgi:hypothetical protein